MLHIFFIFSIFFQYFPSINTCLHKCCTFFLFFRYFFNIFPASTHALTNAAHFSYFFDIFFSVNACLQKCLHVSFFLMCARHVTRSLLNSVCARQECLFPANNLHVHLFSMCVRHASFACRHSMLYFRSNNSSKKDCTYQYRMCSL